MSASLNASNSKKNWGKNHCLVAVRTMFGLEANGKEPTAYAAWLAEGGHDGANTHYQIPPPRDVPGFLCHKTGDPGAGHVVICCGDGTCWSTDFDGKKWTMDGKLHHVTLASLESAGGMRWLGWTETLEGVRIHPHVVV